MALLGRNGSGELESRQKWVRGRMFVSGRRPKTWRGSWAALGFKVADVGCRATLQPVRNTNEERD